MNCRPTRHLPVCELSPNTSFLQLANKNMTHTIKIRNGNRRINCLTQSLTTVEFRLFLSVLFTPLLYLSLFLCLFSNPSLPRILQFQELQSLPSLGEMERVDADFPVQNGWISNRKLKSKRDVEKLKSKLADVDFPLLTNRWISTQIVEFRVEQFLIELYRTHTFDSTHFQL